MERSIKSFSDFVNESKNFEDNFELTDCLGQNPKISNKLISDNYPVNLTYKGNEFFNDIYMDSIIDFAKDELEIGETYYEEYEEMDDDGEFYMEEEEGTTDGQEVYLGYLPDEDIFISGWDMFGNRDDQNIVYIKIDHKMEPQLAIRGRDIKRMVIGRGMMYGSGMMSTYNELHKAHKNLVDIRLD